MPKVARITISLPPNMARSLAAMATAQNMSVSGLVAQYIADGLRIEVQREAVALLQQELPTILDEQLNQRLRAVEGAVNRWGEANLRVAGRTMVLTHDALPESMQAPLYEHARAEAEALIKRIKGEE